MDKTKHAQRLQADARSEKRLDSFKYFANVFFCSFASMRRSRQMLQGIGVRHDMSMSDTEDYTASKVDLRRK